MVSSTILKMLFEGLMRVNKKGMLEGGLAEKVEISEDQTIYSFTLREAFWSNGSKVTAHDFEYAWKTALSPSFNSLFAYLFYPIKNAQSAKNGTVHIDDVGVHALNDMTLKVELEFPAPYFLESAALTIYSPVCKAVDEGIPHWPFLAKEKYVCNGAFRLASNDLNEQYVLTKNSRYWDHESIRLDEILILKSNLQNPIEMFQKGMVDWVGTQIKTKPFKFDLRTEDEIVTAEHTGVYWVVFNTTKFPFTNKKIRQALAMGINRLELQTILNVSPAISPMPIAHSHVKESILSIYSSFPK